MDQTARAVTAACGLLRALTRAEIAESRTGQPAIANRDRPKPSLALSGLQQRAYARRFLPPPNRTGLMVAGSTFEHTRR